MYLSLSDDVWVTVIAVGAIPNDASSVIALGVSCYHSAYCCVSLCCLSAVVALSLSCDVGDVCTIN